MARGRHSGDGAGVGLLAQQVEYARNLLDTIRVAQQDIAAWERDRATALAALGRMAVPSECIDTLLHHISRASPISTRRPTRQRSAESHWLYFADHLLGLTDRHKADILYPDDTGDALAKVRRLRSGRKPRR